MLLVWRYIRLLALRAREGIHLIAVTSHRVTTMSQRDLLKQRALRKIESILKKTREKSNPLNGIIN